MQKNTIQNLVIVLLSVSAVLLFAQTQLVTQGSNRYLSGLLTPETSSGAPAEIPAKLTDFASPVRIAVSGAYGRYGDLALLTTDSAFAAPAELLREALGSAGTPAACTEREFRAALDRTSVYYDFGAELPMPIVAGLVGAETGADKTPARRLLLSSGEQSTQLFWSAGDTYSVCKTGVSGTSLAELVNSYQLGNAVFAFELSTAETLCPYSLFPAGGTPELPSLTAAHTVDNLDGLLTALNFNPHTNSRYTESSGTEVIVEGDRTLRLLPDGTIRYESGGETDTLEVAAGDALTDEQAVTDSFGLLSSLLNSDNGASLCLRSLKTSGDDRTLTFDYQIGGVMIRQGGGAPAAEIRLNGTGVASFSLCFRQYTATDAASLLLPLKQTLAIARDYAGAELDICYTDVGAGSLSAGWLAE
jgi:hypothetical protein